MTDRDDILLQAIESGVLDKSADADLADTFAAHQKLDSLFDLLRQPAFPSTEHGFSTSRLPTRTDRQTGSVQRRFHRCL